LKTRRNAERLIGYLREQHQPVTVARIVAAGIMNSHDASDAIQYGVRHGVIERIKRRGARANERVQYRLTSHSLPATRKDVAAPSFDALLTAWGIAHTPRRSR
jgi:pantothenate kinase type III